MPSGVCNCGPGGSEECITQRSRQRGSRGRSIKRYIPCAIVFTCLALLACQGPEFFGRLFTALSKPIFRLIDSLCIFVQTLVDIVVDFFQDLLRLLRCGPQCTGPPATKCFRASLTDIHATDFAFGT